MPLKPFVVYWTNTQRERLLLPPEERGFPMEYDALDFVESLLKERDKILKEKKNTIFATKLIILKSPHGEISGNDLYALARRIRD